MTHTGGRPPVGPKTTIRLEPELRAAVDAWAEQEGLPLGAAVHSLLAEGLRVEDERQKHRAAWERHMKARGS